MATKLVLCVCIGLTNLSFINTQSVLIFFLFSHLPPSQGGRYAGFGNTIETKKDDDFFDNTISSLSTVSKGVVNK